MAIHLHSLGLKLIGVGITGLFLAGCVRVGLPSATSTSPVSNTPVENLAASPSPVIAASETSVPAETITPELPIPTVTPSPPAPTETPTPFPITLSPEPSPTPEPTLPIAAIEITRPGPLSKVISPFRVGALLEPGARGQIRVELLGEDGRLLVRKVLVYRADPGKKINLITDIEFEIAAVAETGRLVISVEDGWGRTTNLASVDLLLLNEGDYDTNPAGDQLAPIIIEEPSEGETITTTEFIVSGLARPQEDRPLELELVTREGSVVGTRQAAVAEGPPEEHRPFAAAIPYQVDKPTWVLLVVRERSGRIPGATHIVSREILLSPQE